VIRTFKRKDLIYLRRVILKNRVSEEENRRDMILGICRYLSEDDYQDFAPHETGKILINK
jgi:hypothetical protein